MRAAVYHGGGRPVAIEDVTLRDPGPGEVRVALKAAGLCHSDLSVVDGSIPYPVPVVLGHEGAGVVEAVGDGVERVAVGDHVALSWTPSCGACEECVRGLPQLCSTVWPVMGLGGVMDGTSRLTLDGETV